MSLPQHGGRDRGAADGVGGRCRLGRRWLGSCGGWHPLVREPPVFLNILRPRALLSTPGGVLWRRWEGVRQREGASRRACVASWGEL
jgi:hypothetical protein